MPGYLLHITVSPSGENSTSKKLAAAFLAKFATIHPTVEIRTKDLSTDPIPHLDGEAIFAGYTPEDQRSASMVEKEKLRQELIAEIVGAEAILIATPMWNWNMPSVLKAYIDQLIYPGKFDTISKSLAGKTVTALVACGGAYGEGSFHPEYDFLTRYIRTVFGNLGSSDVEVIRAEYCLAGVAPGMEDLLPKKEESFQAALAASTARAAAAVKIADAQGLSSGLEAVKVEVEVAKERDNNDSTAATSAAPAAANNACCIIN